MNSEQYVSTIRGVFTGSPAIEGIVIVGLVALALVGILLLARAPSKPRRG